MIRVSELERNETFLSCTDRSLINFVKVDSMERSFKTRYNLTQDHTPGFLDGRSRMTRGLG